METLLSIITPVLNGEKYIESCIKNVIDQHCPNAEHIVVDGGSIDKTMDVVKRYAREYSHLRYISEKDSGQSDSMNKGIAMAEGAIVGFLNADDYYEPDILNQAINIFKMLAKPSLLVGNCNVLDDSGEVRAVNKPSNLNYHDLLCGNEAINPFPFNPSAYFYHKSLHQTIGLYDSDEHFVMDIDFLLRAIQIADIKYMNQTFGNFRYIEGTKTFVDNRQGKGAIRLHNLLEKYRKQLPLSRKMILRIKIGLYWILERKKIVHHRLKKLL